MYRIPSNKPLTQAAITKYINEHISTVSRLNKLYRYYKCEQDILLRTMSDTTRPNNRLVNSYPNFITDMMTGYFMGKPVTYQTEDKAFIDALTPVFDMNNEPDENATLAKDASIFGVAYELVYLNEDADICFTKLDSRECIPIFDDTIGQNLIYLIRYYKVQAFDTDTPTTKVELYSKDATEYYTMDTEGKLTPTETIPHPFSRVPVVIYENNEELMSDFEPALTLIDAYDKMQSDSLNDYDLLANAYLALKGMEGTELEDLQKAKESRTFLLPPDGDAEWLVKNASGADTEALKTRLVEEIHKLSKCPNLTDANFAGNATGVAMQFKLMGLDNATSKKERAFKRGLMLRIRLITDILNSRGSAYDWRTVSTVFTRNIPANNLDIAQEIQAYRGLLPDETLIARIPFIDDVQAELDKKEKADALKPDITFLQPPVQPQPPQE